LGWPCVSSMVFVWNLMLVKYARITIEFADADIPNKRQWEEDIKTVLSVVPEKDLEGLGRIIVTEKLTFQDRETRGLYYQAQQGNAALIRLSTTLLLPAKGLSSQMTLARRSCVAHVLLHEIGHHYMAISKEPIPAPSQKFADAYAYKRGRRLFPWKMGISGFLVTPILWLVEALLGVRRHLRKRGRGPRRRMTTKPID